MKEIQLECTEWRCVCLTRYCFLWCCSYQLYSLSTSRVPVWHNLRVERFYKPRMINGRMASADGPIKTFPLRGIKDSPPYLHDDRLLTLEDTVEFFNLVLQLELTEQEKKDLVAFMRVL